MAILENAIARYLTSGVVPGPIGNRHPSITPFEGFKAKDGYVIIAVGNDRLWTKFCNLIGRPELIKDERFVSNPQRTQNQKALKAILDTVFPAKQLMNGWPRLMKLGFPAVQLTPSTACSKILK